MVRIIWGTYLRCQLKNIHEMYVTAKKKVALLNGIGTYLTYMVRVFISSVPLPAVCFLDSNTTHLLANPHKMI